MQRKTYEQIVQSAIDTYMRESHLKSVDDLIYFHKEEIVKVIRKQRSLHGLMVGRKPFNIDVSGCCSPLEIVDTLAHVPSIY